MLVGHAGVVSALHIFDGGGGVVSFSWVRACDAGVHAVEPEAMGPAIKHVDPIIGDDGSCWCSGWGLRDRAGCGSVQMECQETVVSAC